MNLPLWAIRNIVYPGGARQDKLIPWVAPRDLCGKCKQKFDGTRYYRGDLWLCRNCDARSAGWQPKILPAAPTEQTGNLIHWEYRFWIGIRTWYAGQSVCRVCRTYCYSRVDRTEHKSHLTPACTYRMTEAIKILNKKGNCVVCKKETKRRVWGIPLCSENDQKEWMFGMQRWVLLELALLESGGSVSLESSSSPIDESRRLYPAGGS